MSYLGYPRLHFAGRFSATISTVNNDAAHYDNARFRPEYQQPTEGAAWNGWFNPRGDANWRLIGCRVTAALMSDGSGAARDPVRRCFVADSDRLPPAKLADLDPEQQLCSVIWGLEMRICDAAGTNLLRGAFQPAPFMDIWSRAITAGGDNSASAMYQSVLSALEWGDVSRSPFLTELRAAAEDGLSVKFNVDGVNMTPGSPEFLRGRITGTIGVASASEPSHFVRGHQLMATSAGMPGFPVPVGGINNCVARVDPGAAAVHLDLGNALPTATPGGPVADLGTLTLAYVDENGEPAALGRIRYESAGWYEKTAGVVSLSVTAAQLDALAGSPIAILKPFAGGTAVAIAEPPGGLHVRADQFVYLLDPGATATVQLYASRFGAPYPQATIKVIHDPYQLQGPPFGGVVAPGVPAGAVDFPDELVADADGMASLPIFSRDPGNPREFLDGQVYGVRPMLAETVAPGAAYPFNVFEFVSVLVFDTFVPDEPPTWWGSLQPIFQQYANLYPVMDDLVDLADYESVCDMREMMLLAFELPVGDPNSMPVTRDLSSAKRAAILRWLRNLGPDGKPLLGPVPPPAAPATSPLRALAAVAPDGEAAPRGAHPHQGAKAAAMTRRLAVARRERPS
jgi:hypothetical protein